MCSSSPDSLYVKILIIWLDTFFAELVMKDFGIYILANDVVYDLLIALLNSIEVNVGTEIPICIVPYDDRLKLVKSEMLARQNITLFTNEISIKRWDDFAIEVWNNHPVAKTKNRPPTYRKNNLIRKMCSFDGDFRKFVFYDADSLAMSKLDKVIDKLEQYDFVFDDWEHAKASGKTAFNIPLVQEKTHLPEREIRDQIHCSSFFGAKQGVIGAKEMEMLKQKLIQDNEVAWINNIAWWCDADLFSYMTFRLEKPIFNFTLSPHGEDRTGNCANRDPFVNMNNVLYNQQGLKPIHRLHYMGYPAHEFTRLSQGEDVAVLFRDEFLHYRFLKQPERKPQQLKPANIVTKVNRLLQKSVQKIRNLF